MQIDSIYVSGWGGDVRFTQCCVASIRQWYPDIRICLLKDELSGSYNTSTLERTYNVEIFGSSPQLYGFGAAKLEPLFQPGNERCLLIDSDVIFIGPLLDQLQLFDDDFVVVDENHSEDEIKRHYFDPGEVERLYPGFHFPGKVFNTGQLVARSGILQRSDFLPFMSFDHPPRFLRPDVFRFGEQGLLNFILLSRQQAGTLTLRSVPFMRWPPGMKEEEIELARIGPDSAYDYLLHWAGPKDFENAPLAHVLRHFDTIFNKESGRHSPDGIGSQLP